MRNTSIQSTPFTKNYFAVIKELKQNKVYLLTEQPKKPLTKITEGIYTKYSSDIESYIKKNKSTIQFRATTKYDNITIDSFITEVQIYKQTILNKIKDNPSLIPTLNEAVKEEEIILTPLLEKTQSLSTLNDKLDKNNFDSVKRSAKVMRVVEYTHRFKREKMQPKKNIFNKPFNSKKTIDENKVVFDVMKNAVDQIQYWWMNIKKKYQNKCINNNYRKFNSHNLFSSSIQKPLVNQSYIDKLRYNLNKILIIQKLIRSFLKKNNEKRSDKKKEVPLPFLNTNINNYYSIKKHPIFIVKIKPMIIYKEIKLKQALYLDENDAVSFRDVNEHSMNLQSFNMSHNSSLEESVGFNNDTNGYNSNYKEKEIVLLMNKVTKICFNSIVTSLMLNNKSKALLKYHKVTNKLILYYYQHKWKNRAKVYAYSALIEMNKSKKYLHTFIYKSNRFQDQLNYTFYQIKLGFDSLFKLYLKPFKMIKHKQSFIKCNLFYKLVSQKPKEDLLYRLLLYSIDSKKYFINNEERKNKLKKLHLDILNRNYKGLIPKQYNNELSHEKNHEDSSEESNDEIIEQEDFSYSSDDTLTEKESINGDVNHSIPNEINTKFVSRNIKLNFQQETHKSNDDTNRKNVPFYLVKHTYSRTQDKSKSAEKIRFVSNNNNSSGNIIMMRDGKSIDYENML